MKLGDIEITFGSSVLVEKTHKTDFSCLIDCLSREVSGSFLHSNINNTGWVTIIRYSKLTTNLSEDFCLFRALVFRPIKYKKTLFDEEEFRSFLNFHSEGFEGYHAKVDGIEIFDTTPIICDKELLSSIILETLKVIKLNSKTFYLNKDRMYFTLANLKKNLHFGFADRLTNCYSLYGPIKDKEYANDYRIFHTPDITSNSLILIKKEINEWKTKIKRKGRRALKKSLTLNPI